MDTDEFPGGGVHHAKTPSHYASYKDAMPMLSPKVKTLSEIKDMHSGNTPVHSMNSLKNSFIQDRLNTQGNDNSIYMDAIGSKIIEESSEEVTPTMSYQHLRFHSFGLFDVKKIALLNMEILEKTLDYMESGDILNFSKVFKEYRELKKYKQLFKHRLNFLLLKTLDNREQYYFWNAFVNFKLIKEKNPLTFTTQFVKDCPHLKNITKDLDRTLPEYDKYTTKSGKDSLLRVLVAISNTVTDTGYIQGLNSIAGTFLFYLKEEESFWMTLFMMEKLKVKDIFAENFHRVHILNYQLQIFLEFYIPEISHHIEQGPVEMSYFTTPWFITLYSYFFTLDNIIKAWNLYFVKGNSFLIQLGLAVFSRYKEKIMSISIDDLGNFLKHDLRTISENDDQLFYDAMNFKVSRVLMNEIEHAYDHKGKPAIKLVRGFNKKLKLEPVSKLSKSLLNSNVSNSRHHKNNMTIDLSHDSESRPHGITPRSSKKLESPHSNSNSFVDKLKDISGSLKNMFSSIRTPKASGKTAEFSTEHTEESQFFDAGEPSRLRLKSDANLKNRIDEEAPRTRAHTERNLNVKSFASAPFSTGNNNDSHQVHNIYINSCQLNESSNFSPPQHFQRQKTLTAGPIMNQAGIQSILKLGLYDGYKNSDSSPSSGLSPRKSDEFSFSFQPATKLNSEPLTPNSLKNRELPLRKAGRDRINSSPRTAF